MVTEFKRYAKYEVIKLEDIENYLNPYERFALFAKIGKIQSFRKRDGKTPCNKYVVINEEEPYAKIVWKLIEAGETMEKKDLAILLSNLEGEF